MRFTSRVWMVLATVIGLSAGGSLGCFVVAASALVAPDDVGILATPQTSAGMSAIDEKKE